MKTILWHSWVSLTSVASAVLVPADGVSPVQRSTLALSSSLLQWAVGMVTTSEWTEVAFPLWHNNTYSPRLHKTHTHPHTVGHKRQQSFSCPLTLSKTHTHTRARVTKSLHVKHCVAVVSGSRGWVGKNETYNRPSVPLHVPRLSLSCSVLSLNKFQGFFENFNQSGNGMKPFCSLTTVS